MSYYLKSDNNTKLLRKMYEYPYLNERIMELSNKNNVIEIGFWVKDILQ